MGHVAATENGGGGGLGLAWRMDIAAAIGNRFEDLTHRYRLHLKEALAQLIERLDPLQVAALDRSAPGLRADVLEPAVAPEMGAGNLLESGPLEHGVRNRGRPDVEPMAARVQGLGEEAVQLGSRKLGEVGEAASELIQLG